MEPRDNLRRIVRIGSLLAGLIVAPTVHAVGGIVTDGSVGPKATFGGKEVLITEDVGSKAGNNLFHSFSEFNVHRGQTVTFTEAHPNTLDNVITRVTGNTSSEIEGTLRSTPGGHANFYLINPKGITFGQGASIDVPGAFHVSTADELKFKDGARYSAIATNGSTLSSAPPAAFGFLAASSANNGLLKAVNGAQLSTQQPGKILDAVAGGVTIEKGAKLAAPAGEIRLVAVQGRTDVSVETTADGHLSLPNGRPSTTNAGVVTVQQSEVATSGNGGGKIGVWGSAVSFKDGAEIAANNEGPNLGGTGRGITVVAGNFTLSNAAVNSIAKASGDAGSVMVETAGDLDIKPGGYINSSTEAAGNAGNLTIRAGRHLNITGPSSAAAGGTGLFAQAEGGTGKAGAIDVESGRDLTIRSGGVISATTFAAGDAGNIKVVAHGRLMIEGVTDKRITGITAQADQGSSGNAGNVEVDSTGDMTIRRVGQIASTTLGSGHGGNVTVKPGGKLIIDAEGIIQVKDIENPLTGIGTSAGRNEGPAGKQIRHTGDAGNVTVKSKSAVIVRNGGEISSFTYGDGKAGNVTVKAGTLTVDNKASEINAGSIGRESSGKTGRVKIYASKSVAVTKGGKISLENDAEPPSANDIKPGRINVTAPVIQLLNHGQITSRSKGSVDAADIRVNFDHELVLTNNSFIRTTAKTGNGGAIAINGGEFIELRDSGFQTSVSAENGNGGNIRVRADNSLLETGDIEANAKSGNGGDIRLDLQALITSGNTLNGKEINSSDPFEQRQSSGEWTPFQFGKNVIEAVSETGLDGTISLTSPQLNLSGVLANLGNPDFDSRVIQPDYCAIKPGSSLSILGQGGLEPKGADLILY